MNEQARRIEALESENARLKAQLAQAAGITQLQQGLRSTAAGHDVLFAAVEKTRMPMILTDPNQPDNPIIFANRAFQELCGYSSEELVGRNCRFLQGPDTDQNKVEQIRDAVAKEQDYASEIINYRRDGTPFVNDLYISPVYDNQGKLLYQFGSQLDISIFRQNEAALERTEARYRTLFEVIDQGFCVIEFFDGPYGPLSDYVHIEANGGYERQTGIANIVGQTVRGLTPADADEWVEIYGGVLRTGKPIHFEREFALADRFIEVRAHRIEPASLRQVAVLFSDITDRKRAERILRNHAANLEEQVVAQAADVRLFGNMIQSSIAPICAFDTQFRLIAFNQAHSDEFFRIMGHRVQLGEVFPDLFPPEQAPVIRGFMARALGGETYTVTEEFGDPDLAKPYWEVSYTPLRNSAGAIVGAFHYARDISARLRAETELASIQDTLRQAQKMEAVGQLTGGLAHDFNNLLAGITGSLELLAIRIQQGRIGEIDKFIIAAQGAAKRAAALTHRLLAFSRQQTLQPKAVNVNNLATGLLDLIQRTVGPAINVQMVGQAGLWPALVDPSQLENALLNLCINARDAMPDGGKITIETGNRWMDREGARQHDMPEGQYLSICVTDTGTGMPAAVIAKAFDPFFTTKPIGQGTGLGLSMIYGFAKQSGGQARIYSEVGQGTMVCLYLPRHLGKAEWDEEEAEAKLTPLAEAGETVLIVDDESTVRMLVTTVLEDLGYTAIEAADSVGGLRVLQSNARIDLLVTDVGLPGGMNGRQMADAARATRPDLKVLFITGFAENALLNNGQLEPGMSVLTKPFAVDTLAARIRELITAP